MEYLFTIIQKAVSLGATDIHLAPGQLPVYRIKRQLFYDQTKLPVTDVTLFKVFEYFCEQMPSIEKTFLARKQLDFSYRYGENRFRVNVSLTKRIPTFSFRVIPNNEINVKEMGLRDILTRMKRINNGLILLTGKVNSGKSTTMNAFIQEVNKEESKKIVMLEDPIEYEHQSNKSIIIQKEIGEESDVLSYYDGLINLLREDADIAVLGEIRDKKTMDVAIDLAESGGLVIGTLHTRSCGETVERIINLYDPADQMSIKNSISTVLKMVVSQKLIVSTAGNLLMVPEIMIVSNTIAAQIRQEKFNVSDIEDGIHSQKDIGCVSFENSFTDLYIKGLVDMNIIKEQMEPDRVNVIKSLIINSGANLE